jgi:hypothetical protein
MLTREKQAVPQPPPLTRQREPSANLLAVRDVQSAGCFFSLSIERTNRVEVYNAGFRFVRSLPGLPLWHAELVPRKLADEATANGKNRRRNGSCWHVVQIRFCTPLAISFRQQKKCLAGGCWRTRT